MKSDSNRICSIKSRLPETCNGSKINRLNMPGIAGQNKKKAKDLKLKDSLIEKIQ